MSAPPQFLQDLHRILKRLVSTQGQAARYLNIVKQYLTLAVPQFDLEKSGLICKNKKSDFQWKIRKFMSSDCILDFPFSPQLPPPSHFYSTFASVV